MEIAIGCVTAYVLLAIATFVVRQNEYDEGPDRSLARAILWPVLLLRLLAVEVTDIIKGK